MSDALRDFAAEVRACLDGQVWRDAQPAYRRLYAALKKAEAALAQPEETKQ